MRGYVSAYDAETGKLAWRFYTVPGDPSKPQENKALETRAADVEGQRLVEVRRRRHGVGLDRLRPRAEPALRRHRQRLAVEPRTCAAPAAATTCISRRSSRSIPTPASWSWHYQTTPGDTWDYTAVQPMMLADLTIGGRARKVIMQAPKNGFFYVLDRATGELLSADKYVEVNWASHVDMKTGRPVEIPGADYEDEGTYIRPGPLGGHNWQAMSFSPKTGLVYIPAQDNGALLRAAGRNFAVQGRSDATSGRAVNLAASIDAGGTTMPLQGPAARVGSGRAQAAMDRRVPAPTGTAARSRPPATSCSRARRPATSSPTTRPTGEKLWSSWAGTGIVAPPITYAIDGKQYVR